MYYKFVWKGSLLLNHIWLGFFVIAFVAGLYHWIFLGDSAIWAVLVQSLFDTAKLAFDVALGLVGVLCLWMGLLRIAEKAGIVNGIAKGLSPLFRRLMPELPENHPAMGSMTMNIAANILGLDNAATPIGLQAMKALQTLNPLKSVASNAQILFLVINASSVTLLPVTIFMYRAQQGSVDPTAVFIPIIIATSASTLAGLCAVAWVQKLPIFDRVVLAYAGGFIVLITTMVWYFSYLPKTVQAEQSSLLGNFTLFAVVILFLVIGYIKKIPVYDCFIEGAKEGLHVAIRIVPYLVAMLVAIGVFRASGVLDGLLQLTEKAVAGLGLDTSFVPALPTAFIKPFSGSGARAMMIETMQHYGADSFPATVAAIIQGSTETTFYVLAVYFGSVGIKQARHAVACALLADGVGIVVSILIGYWFFR